MWYLVFPGKCKASKRARLPAPLPTLPRELHERRRILANADEPSTGDYDFGFYNKAHPVFGDPDTIKRIKRELRGLRGEWVTVIASGLREDENGDEHRYRFKRTVLYSHYEALFGPGSAYADIVHSIVEKYSDDALTTLHLDIEITPEEDIPDDEVFL